MTTVQGPAGHPPALPAPLRRPAALVVGVAVFVFLVLTALYARTNTAGRVDGRAEDIVDSAILTHRWLFDHLILFGSPSSVVFCAFALAGVCLLLGRRRLALLAVVGPGLTGLATTALKPAIGRTTVDGSAFAYPSGHTGGATALGLVLALFVVSVVRPGPVAGTALLAVGAVLAGGTVGVGMIAVGSHYPTDTIGGFCTAVALVLGSALVIERVADRRWLHADES